MPLLVGMILGALLTVGAAFAYDSTTGRAANGLEPSAAGVAYCPVVKNPADPPLARTRRRNQRLVAAFI